MGNSQFVPSFARSSPRGGTPSRRSQHGKQGNKDTSRSGGGSGSGGGRQSTSGKPNLIQINLSRDVKLNESENAWKPKVIKKDDKSAVVGDGEKEALNVSFFSFLFNSYLTTSSSKILIFQDLCKKFRSLLNKLSPQNFQKLISQVPALKIDTRDKLASVIGLVFEKAIDEPGFSETYALMCKELEQIKVLWLVDSYDETFTKIFDSFTLLYIRSNIRWAMGTGNKSSVSGSWSFKAVGMNSKKRRSPSAYRPLNRKKSTNALIWWVSFRSHGWVISMMCWITQSSDFNLTSCWPNAIFSIHF